MDTNNINSFDSESKIPIFRILYKNLVLIILITVLAALAGLYLAIKNERTVYTASQSAILSSSLSGSTSTGTYNDAVLSGMLIGEVDKCITTPNCLAKANEIHRAKFINEANGVTEDVAVIKRTYNPGLDGISAGAISITSNDTLIFIVSYSDTDEERVKEKLESFYQAAKLEIADKFVSEPPASIIKTNDEFVLSSVNTNMNNVVIFALVGLILGVVVAFLRYILDNTVTDKSEYEQEMGVNVIALIEDIPQKILK